MSVILDTNDVLADVLDAIEPAAVAGTIRWTDAAELLRLTERILNRDLDKEFEIAWKLWRESLDRGEAEVEPVEPSRPNYLHSGRVDLDYVLQETGS